MVGRLDSVIIIDKNVADGAGGADGADGAGGSWASWAVGKQLEKWGPCCRRTLSPTPHNTPSDPPKPSVTH